MSSNNPTVVAALLHKTDNGKFAVKEIIVNPTIPQTTQVVEEKGKITIVRKPTVPGYYLRRFMTVNQIKEKLGVSKNQAQRLRHENPLACLADFEGQEPLADLLRQATGVVSAA